MKHRECIVHIGMPKTGSTSIQKTFFKGIESETFYYFDLGESNHGRRVTSLFSSDEALPQHRKLNFSKSDITRLNLDTKEKLIDNIKNCTKPVMIISGEVISAFLSQEELEEFRDFLDQYFQKITIIAYVRTVKSYIESKFQQQVKSGNKGDFNVEEWYPEYQETFEKFDLAFGRENVKLWKFDPKSFTDGDVVMDFCNRLGIEMRIEQTERVNDSLTKEALSLLYIYRKYGPRRGVGSEAISENNDLIKKLRTLGHKKVKFSPSLFEKILEKNKSDLLWIEGRLSEKLTENMAENVDDIKSEVDLLSVDETIVEELKVLIGQDYMPISKNSNKQQEIVDLIHALRMKGAKKKSNENITGKDKMKLIELAQVVKKDNTETLGNLNEKKIAMIIKASLKQIKKEIENTETGKVKVAGFGNFNIRMLEKEREGKKVLVRRTVYSAAKEK